MDILYQFNRGWDKTNVLIDVLKTYKKNISTSAEPIRTLFAMIPYCRDIYFGKGERDLSYRMIYAWYQVFPVLALKAIHLLFLSREGFPPVGSWCDVKHFCVFIEKISPYGAEDPLILSMASIANQQIRKDCASEGVISNVVKWIPRECRYPELFSVFARDWFSCDILSVGKKKIYRKIVSGLSARLPGKDTFGVLFSKLASGKQIHETCGPFGFPAFPTLFIGEYVKTALRLSNDNDIAWIERKWHKLLQTFPNGSYGIPIVDLDMPDDKLFHALGYACLIADKMGLKRILLAGSTPIWVDISVCNGFVSIVQLLWSFCDARCGSKLTESILLVSSGIKYIFEGNMKIFVFSENFLFDWAAFINLLGKRGVAIFWNMGSSFDISPDFYPNLSENTNEFIYMSGYAPGLIAPFCSLGFDVCSLYVNILDS